MLLVFLRFSFCFLIHFHYPSRDYLAYDHNNEKNLYFGKIIHGPVLTEREKLEKIAMSLNIEYGDKSDEQLRLIILKKMKNDN